MLTIEAAEKIMATAKSKQERAFDDFFANNPAILAYQQAMTTMERALFRQMCLLVWTEALLKDVCARNQALRDEIAFLESPHKAELLEVK